MSRNYVRADSQVYNSNETNGNVRKLADCINTANEIKVSITGDDPSGHGLATEAKQDDMISLLTGQTPALNRTKAIPVQIMVGDAGDNFDALRANGQDLLVMIDDMNPDVALNSGLARSDKQDTLNASLASVGTDEVRVEVVSGTVTATVDSVVVKGNDGNDGSGTDRTIKTDGNGAVIVDPSAGSIITADGVTEEQRVMICGNKGGNLRTVKVGDGGAVNTEVDHSWSNTNQIFNAEACADGATIESSTFDLSQDVSHEIGKVEFFLDNSATVAIEVKGLTSYNGTDFYNSGSAYSVNSSDEKIYFSQEDVGIGSGHRYMKLSVTNNDGLGTSTNISCQVGYYK